MKTSAFALASGGLIGVAFLFPESFQGMLFACAFLFCLTWFVPRSKRLYRDLFLTGIVLHLVGFYWLPYTISFFGGFPSWLAYLLFALFCAVSSIQLLLVAYIFQRVSSVSGTAKLFTLPLAWFSAEFLLPKMFPWVLAHPFIVWTSFAGLAEYVGVYPLGAVLLAASSLILGHPDVKVSVLRRCSIALVILLFFHTIGLYRERTVEEDLAVAPRLRIALVQGNLEAKTKGDIHYLDSNLAQYQKYSAQGVHNRAELIIWPESVFNDWVPETISQLRGTMLDPDPLQQVPLIYGGLGYRIRSEERTQADDEVEDSNRRVLRFNAAFALDAAGRVQSRYYKRVLMPFGEYMPFADLIPALKRLSPMTGEFAAGDITKPLHLEVPSANGVLLVKAGALICYEDLVPAMSRGLVREGAELLVNLTNDAWYGDTAAPYQHHLLALWRAIETRRYFARATNTGFTAVVDPYGRTTAGLALFSAGELTTEIKLLNSRTLYSQIGDSFSWALIGFVALVILRSRLHAR